jgi:septal ring factor EnvC (AmiA/AmiB activator)
MKYFQQYSEFRKKQVAEIKAKQVELQVIITQLAAQKTGKEKLLVEQVRESKKLESVKDEQNRELANLRSKERILKNQLTVQQQKARRLQSEIEKIITTEIRKRSTTATNPFDRMTPDERLISDNFRGNKGRLPWPTERGTITGSFGINPHTLFKNIQLTNSGIDITTVGGAAVRVVFDGEVKGVHAIPGYNLTVLVTHGNYFTVYQNLVDVTVKFGDKLKAKQTIGKVYTERGANTAVLHFEIWEDNNKPNPEKLNPEQWISKS